MLLAIDVGNTQTVLGLYDGETLGDQWRVATESHRSGDELGARSSDGELSGGVVAAGIEISMDALFERAARLFRVEFTTPPTVIGKTTTASLQSGLIYGFAGQVDEIVTRIRGELGVEARA